MAINFSDKKIKEPEDNMRYAERKAVRLMNNGLNNEMETDKLNRKEIHKGNTRFNTSIP